MATTLSELEQRLQALEAEVAALRQKIASAGGGATQPGAAGADPAARNAELDAIYQRMGISGEAPGIEKLRAMLAAEGVLPGDEVVQQVIAAMHDDEEVDDE
jgi:hypothetical protein